MLINLSNHPHQKWQPKQKEMAVKFYGNICDMPFPEVPPEADHEQVARMAQEYYAQILDECSNDSFEKAVHIQGEFTLSFALVNILKNSGIKCIASTSKRDVTEEDGKKVINFQFVQFREY